MYTFTEKHDNISYVKTRILDVIYNIGMIEQGYGNVFLATGLQNETLKDGDTIIFTDFKKAQKAVSDVFKSEFDL
jgi:hypothetical protein